MAGQVCYVAFVKQFCTEPSELFELLILWNELSSIEKGCTNPCGRLSFLDIGKSGPIGPQSILRPV